MWEVEDGFGFFVLSGEEGFPAGAEACVPVPDAAQEALGVLVVVCAKLAVFAREGLGLVGHSVGYLQYVLFFDDLDIEADRAEAVIAGDHGAHGVFHPAVKEVAFAGSEVLDEVFHGVPGRWAHAVGALAVYGYPALAFKHVACVLYGVLKAGHEVGVLGLTDGGYFDFVHVWYVSTDKDTKYICYCHTGNVLACLGVILRIPKKYFRQERFRVGREVVSVSLLCDYEKRVLRAIT